MARLAGGEQIQTIDGDSFEVHGLGPAILVLSSSRTRIFTWSAQCSSMTTT